MERKDLPDNARKQIEEEKERYKEKMQLLMRYWATIASAAVIILSIIQYSYKLGVCQVFRLPISSISIKLNDYIPAVALLCGIAVYIADCLIALKIRQMESKKHFNLIRMAWGTAMVFILLFLILDYNSKSLLRVLLISAILPLVIEVLLWIRIRTHIREAVRKTYRDRLKNNAGGRPFYRYCIKPGIICTLILILLIPLAAKFITVNKHSYEICTIENESYAVVLDYSDDVLIQPALIEADSLTIYTDSYKYVSRTDIDGFIFQRFDKVIISEAKDTD